MSPAYSCPLIAASLLVGPAPAPASPREPPSEKSTVAPASAEVPYALGLLEAGIRQSDAALQKLEDRIPKLRARMQELTQSVESIELAEPEEGSEKSTPGGNVDREVKYRPPLEELTVENQLLFLCKEGRISFVDFDPINAHFQRILEARARKQMTRKETFAFDVPDSDFRVEGYVEGSPLSPGFRRDVTLMRKAGCPGETPQEIQRPESRFRRVLSAHAPSGGYYVSFAVYPDSYDALLAARSIAWEQQWGIDRNEGYDVGWDPKETGEPIKLGHGPGVKG